MAKPRILFVTPCFANPIRRIHGGYLTGFLRSRGYETEQADLGAST